VRDCHLLLRKGLQLNWLAARAYFEKSEKLTVRVVYESKISEMGRKRDFFNRRFRNPVQTTQERSVRGMFVRGIIPIPLANILRRCAGRIMILMRELVHWERVGVARKIESQAGCLYYGGWRCGKFSIARLGCFPEFHACRGDTGGLSCASR
jgi:hypothetical protein